MTDDGLDTRGCAIGCGRWTDDPSGMCVGCLDTQSSPAPPKRSPIRRLTPREVGREIVGSLQRKGGRTSVQIANDIAESLGWSASVPAFEVWEWLDSHRALVCRSRRGRWSLYEVR